MKAKFLYIIALFVIALDQITKRLAETRLGLGVTERVFGRLLFLTDIHNRGGAFGIMQSGTGVLIFISLAVVFVILLSSRRNCYQSTLLTLALALQLGGATGNLIDRVRYGYVVDFIDLGWWPVFNVADAAITVGIFVLGYQLVARSE